MGNTPSTMACSGFSGDIKKCHINKSLYEYTLHFIDGGGERERETDN